MPIRRRRPCRSPRPLRFSRPCRPRTVMSRRHPLPLISTGRRPRACHHRFHQVDWRVARLVDCQVARHCPTTDWVMCCPRSGGQQPSLGRILARILARMPARSSASGRCRHRFSRRTLRGCRRSLHPSHWEFQRHALACRISSRPVCTCRLPRHPRPLRHLHPL